MSRLSCFPSPRRVAQEITAATALGIFLGVIGPFGSFYGGGVELRIAYWTLNLWAGYAILSVTARLSLRVAGVLEAPPWFALGAGVLVGALPLTLFIRIISVLIWPPARHGADPFAVLYLQCLALAEPFSFLYALILGGGVIPPSGSAFAPKPEIASRGRQDLTPAQLREGPPLMGPGAAPAPTAPGADAPAPFLNRLSGRLGADLLCLTMEDHYVRAHTDVGSELVLIPLKQALTELSSIEGLQVHRSAWVARSAVVEAVQKDRNVMLR